MDSPTPYDIWKKYEKSISATFNYNYFLKVRKKLLVVLIISLSWTQLPAAAVKFSGGASLGKLSSYLCNTHSVFLFWNGIVIVLLLLNRRTDITTNSVIYNGCGETELMMSASEIFVPLFQPETAAVEDGGAGAEETIKTVCWESVCDEVTTATAAIEPAPEKCKQEIVALQRESRGCCVVESSAIENLNSEEFRHRIEMFIRKNYESFKLEKERTAKH